MLRRTTSLPHYGEQGRPAAYAAVPPVGSQALNTREWDGNFCQCCGDCGSGGWGTCLLGTFFPCVLFGTVRARAFGQSCCCWGLLFFILSSWWLPLMPPFKKMISTLTEEEEINGVHIDVDISHSYSLAILIMWIILIAIAASTRCMIRKRFGVKGGDCEDVMLKVCCMSCSLCQEARTLEKNNVENGDWYGQTRYVPIITQTVAPPPASAPAPTPTPAPAPSPGPALASTPTPSPIPARASHHPKASQTPVYPSRSQYPLQGHFAPIGQQPPQGQFPSPGQQPPQGQFPSPGQQPPQGQFPSPGQQLLQGHFPQGQQPLQGQYPTQGQYQFQGQYQVQGQYQTQGHYQPQGQYQPPPYQHAEYHQNPAHGLESLAEGGSGMQAQGVPLPSTNSKM